MNKKRRFHAICRWDNALDTPSTLVLALLTASLLSGCLSRPSLVREDFTFSTPAGGSVTGPLNGRVLAIRKLTIAAPFASQSFVYRTGEFSYERDSYAEFLVPPEESLVGPLRAYFRKSGAFSEVVEPGSALKPNILVEIAVPQLYGDFRKPAAPASVLAMRFVFFNASNGLPDRVLSQRSYARRIPVKNKTAAAVMAGWNEALKQIMAEVTPVRFSGSLHGDEAADQMSDNDPVP